MTYSVVIPTRDRLNELGTLLHSLASQTLPASEIIVVDAGGRPIEPDFFIPYKLPIRHLHSSPSVCKQRNAGIALASEEFVFLCDDDMDLPQNYVESILLFMTLHPEHGVVSGMITERWNGGPVGAFPPASFLRLIWNCLFMLSIWSNLHRNASSLIESGFLRLIRSWIGSSNNGLSVAGWPRVTSVDDPFFRTRVYGLGASVIRRAWLPESPYDEILDEFGIGDNYGLAMRLPGVRPITVLSTIEAFHKRSSSGRISSALASFRRILALDYFRRSVSPRPLTERIALLWSLVGLFLASAFRGNMDHSRAIALAAWLILNDSNPYVNAKRQGKTGPVNAMYA